MKNNSMKTSATSTPANGESEGRGRSFWQNAEQQEAGIPLWDQPEFQESVNDMIAERDARDQKGHSRKDFFKFMGAGAVLAGAACRRPTEQIIPAVDRPAEMTPGIPSYYSSSAPDGTGIVIKTREGRPVKIAGNRSHPLTRGGVDASLSAATMDLYDPDRLRKPVKFAPAKGKRRRKLRAKADDVIAAARTELKKGSYVLMTGPVDSPSTRSLIGDFLRAVPGGRHVEMRPDSTLRQIADGQARSYGQTVVPNYRIHQADYILSIDADFLGTFGNASYHAASFAQVRALRDGRKQMAKLVSIEAMMSLTGSNADERHVVRPGEQHLAALAIAAELVVNQGRASTGASFLRAYRPQTIASKLNHSVGFFRKGSFEKTIKKIANELWSARGKGLVMAGSPLTATASAGTLQVAVNLLNSILGNDGRTVDYAGGTARPGTSERELQRVLTQIKSGRIKNVILAGANPAYHLPAAMKAQDALKGAGYLLSITDRLDESALLGSAALPLSHFLESWGDSELVSGVASIRQPAIRPLYDSRSLEDYLIALAGGSLGGSSDFHTYLKRQWGGRAKGSFQSFWVSLLQEGYYSAGSKAVDAPRKPRAFKTSALGALPSRVDGAAFSESGLKLGLYYNTQVHDGSLANNAYRLELPDPITKIVWDNYVVMLPDTARKLKLRQGSVVEVSSGGRKLKLPVHMQPGVAPGSALIALGFGRTAVGRVGNKVGGNGLDLLSGPGRGSGQLAFSGAKATVKDTGNIHELASTQRVYRNGFSQEDKAFFAPKGMPGAEYGSSSRKVFGEERPIVREATLAAYSKAKTYKDVQSVMKPGGIPIPTKNGKEVDARIMTSWVHDTLRWHMAIDLSACTGCSACVTSCNVENNVPVVGREEVGRGREMQWLRIDRYYRGDEASPEVVHQPMMCQHCENAPCENVCPVAATSHNSEGLNVMTYNRCVGTRYCSNNCPYKVRRFNWFENWTYAGGLEQATDYRNHLLHWGAKYRPRFRSPQQLGLNPDVTVRTRGVMEKCTFCIQRIAGARQEMKSRQDKTKTIRDGAVVTACQEVCPSQAISFGDINDKKSEVAHLVRNPKTRDKRGYQVLDFLGVKPSVTYLGKIRNTTNKA